MCKFFIEKINYTVGLLTMHFVIQRIEWSCDCRCRLGLVSISSHIVASLWTAAAIEMFTDEEVTKSERIKMGLIVITVVIIISLSIIILLLLLASLFLERIIKKSLNYIFFYFNFLIMLLLSNSSHEIIIDH